jgi:hypothetical protein
VVVVAMVMTAEASRAEAVAGVAGHSVADLAGDGGHRHLRVTRAALADAKRVGAA